MLRGANVQVGLCHYLVDLVVAFSPKFDMLLGVDFMDASNATIRMDKRVVLLTGSLEGEKFTQPVMLTVGRGAARPMRDDGGEASCTQCVDEHVRSRPAAALQTPAQHARLRSFRAEYYTHHGTPACPARLAAEAVLTSEAGVPGEAPHVGAYARPEAGVPRAGASNQAIPENWAPEEWAAQAAASEAPVEAPALQEPPDSAVDLGSVFAADNTVTWEIGHSGCGLPAGSIVPDGLLRPEAGVASGPTHIATGLAAVEAEVVAKMAPSLTGIRWAAEISAKEQLQEEEGSASTCGIAQSAPVEVTVQANTHTTPAVCDPKIATPKRDAVGISLPLNTLSEKSTKRLAPQPAIVTKRSAGMAPAPVVVDSGLTDQTAEDKSIQRKGDTKPAMEHEGASKAAESLQLPPNNGKCAESSSMLTEGPTKVEAPVLQFMAEDARAENLADYDKNRKGKTAIETIEEALAPGRSSQRSVMDHKAQAALVSSHQAAVQVTEPHALLGIKLQKTTLEQEVARGDNELDGEATAGCTQQLAAPACKNDTECEAEAGAEAEVNLVTGASAIDALAYEAEQICAHRDEAIDPDSRGEMCTGAIDLVKPGTLDPG